MELDSTSSKGATFAFHSVRILRKKQDAVRTVTMDTELYRELHESAGDDKTLDKVILREVAAEQLGDALSSAPEWSNIGQIGSRSAGSEAKAQR